jgi:hypothetical protein
MRLDKEVGYYQTMVTNMGHELGNCKDSIKMLNLQLDEQAKLATLEFPLLIKTEYKETPSLNLEGK